MFNVITEFKRLSLNLLYCYLISVGPPVCAPFPAFLTLRLTWFEAQLQSQWGMVYFWFTMIPKELPFRILPENETEFQLLPHTSQLKVLPSSGLLGVLFQNQRIPVGKRGPRWADFFVFLSFLRFCFFISSLFCWPSKAFKQNTLKNYILVV